MDIRSVRHKGLRRWLTRGDMAGLPQAHAVKISAMVSFLSAAAGIEAVQRLAVWRAHQLTGDRRGTWSLVVSRNWRLTFRVNDANEIVDLDLEDYH
jgi:toxin HigB-1